MGKPEEKISLGRTRCRWEGYITKYFSDVGRIIHWIDMAQGRDRWRAAVNAVIKLRVP
jgi:hypothetical protein